MIKYKLILQGQKADIYARITNKGNEFDDFVSKLDKKYQHRIAALLKKLIDQGLLYNAREYELMKGTINVIELKVHCGPGFRFLAHRNINNLSYEYIILKSFKKPPTKTQKRLVGDADELSKNIKAGLAVLGNVEEI